MAGECAAAGVYTDSSSHPQALLLGQTGGTWSAGVAATLPANAAANPGASVNAVSCVTAGRCAAVGLYNLAAGSQHGFLVSQSGGTWSPAVEVPLPANGDATGLTVANWVSCLVSGDCTVFGAYRDGAGVIQPLFVNGSPETWGTALQAAVEADATENPGINVGVVSCASAGNCAAVGRYQDASGHGQGLLLTESSGTPGHGVGLALPSDAGTDPNVAVYGVSCGSVGTCTAAGAYADGSGSRQGILVSAAPASPALSVSAPSTAVTGTAIAASGIAGLLSGGAAPVGTMTFRVFGPQASPPSSCGCETMVGTATVSGNGSSAPNASFTPSQPGDYWWYASYGGDASDNPAASTCGAGMAETVVLAAPALTLSGSPLAATLAGGASPTGTVTFTVFGPQAAPPSSCTSGGTTVGTATVSGNGTYAPATASKPSKPGRYWWYAGYGGDGANAPAASACGATMASTTVSRPAPRVRLVGKPKATANGVRFRVRCVGSTGQRCRVAATLTHHAKRVAKKGATIPAGSARTVTLSLNATGRRLLHRLHKLPVTLAVGTTRRKLTIKRR